MVLGENLARRGGDLKVGRKKLHDEEFSKLLLSLNIIRTEDD